MSLKTRLKRLESAIKPEHKDVCIFMTTVYPAGQTKPPVIGYRSDGIQIIRFENEHDDDLQERVQLAVLEKTARQNCGLKVALVFEIFNNHLSIPTEEET
jgi:hypothetical protein